MQELGLLLGRPWLGAAQREGPLRVGQAQQMPHRGKVVECDGKEEQRAFVLLEELGLRRLVRVRVRG